MPQKPNDIVEGILCDADLHHFDGTDYLDKNKALRQEWATLYDLVFTDENWCQINIEFLEQHSFFIWQGNPWTGQADKLRTIEKPNDQL